MSEFTSTRVLFDLSVSAVSASLFPRYLLALVSILTRQGKCVCVCVCVSVCACQLSLDGGSVYSLCRILLPFGEAVTL